MCKPAEGSNKEIDSSLESACPDEVLHGMLALTWVVSARAYKRANKRICEAQGSAINS
jgi:hypothetical protein